MKSSWTITLLRLGAVVGRADPLDVWNWRNPVPTGDRLEAIVYGSGLFVAVGFGGTVVTSTDGITWVQQHSATQYDLEGIAYGNGQFVAVGYSCGAQCDGTIVSSTDGVNWVEHHPNPAVWGLHSVAYGNGQFVAVGNAVLTSSDGINWTERQLRNGWFSLTGIIFASDEFVAVGDNSIIATSPDGVNWSSRDSGTGNDLPSIAFGNGQFVLPTFAAGVPGGSSILVSTNAVAWVQRWSGAGYSFVQPIGVGYGNGLFVVVGAGRLSSTGMDEMLILTSDDGENWFQRHSEAHPLNNFLSAVAYGNGRFVAVGDTGMILTSTDGITWVQSQSGTTDQLNSVAYGNGRYVVVGGRRDPFGGSEPNETPIMIGADGKEWTPIHTGASNVLRSVIYGRDQFVAVGNPHLNSATGSEESTILTSADGVGWVQSYSGSNSVPYLLSAVVYGKGQYVAVGSPHLNSGTGSQESTILTSADGVQWQQQSSGARAYHARSVHSRFAAHAACDRASSLR